MMTLHPWWWILALCALLPWIGPWRGRDAGQNVLRSLLFIFLTAALTRPHLLRDDAAPQRILILDRSASVDPEASQEATGRALQFAKAGTRKNQHLVLFGSLNDEHQRLFSKEFGSVTVLQDSGPEGNSPLSAALARANSLIPRTSTGTITLASDGLATRPDDARAISALRDRGIPVHVALMPAASTPPTPVGLSWTDELRVGTTARLQATVVARGGGNSGTLTLRSEGRALASALYEGGQREVISLSFEPEKAGFLNAVLSVVPDNNQTNLPQLGVVLPIREPHRLLYLGELQQNGAAELANVLGPGFEVKKVDPANADDFELALSLCDLVVLDDQPAASIPLAAERSLLDAVTNEGLGLVMSGGRAAFGTGGWHDRPIETMLPVESVQKEEKRDPSTTLAVVIDTSGSMSGVRVQLAKEVSRLAIRRLLPHDKVGIVEFYGAKRWAAPIQPASNAIELQRALNRMDAGGGTVIMPALVEAFYALQNVDTRYKHVLVLTDGGVESGDFESLMRRMADEGINVSTVLCGGCYHSEFLVNVANWGKGRFYNVPNRFNLPEILLKQPSTAKLPAYRPGVHQVRARGGSGWWGDVNTATIPGLAGYVETKAKNGSEVLLETVDAQHPVLASWRFGLGRVTTLCTEPVGAGTRPWRDWPDYGKMLARIMERSAADTRDPFHYEITFDGGEVLLHAKRQRPRTGAKRGALPLAKLYRDNDASKPPTNDKNASGDELSFVAKSPNHFLAIGPAPPVGTTWKIMTSASTTSGRWEPLVASSPQVDEQRVDPQRGINLPILSESTGGQVLAFNGNWSVATVKTGGRHMLSLASWLFAAALAFFLVEIVWRRRPAKQIKTPNHTLPVTQ